MYFDLTGLYESCWVARNGTSSFRYCQAAGFNDLIGRGENVGEIRSTTSNAWYAWCEAGSG